MGDGYLNKCKECAKKDVDARFKEKAKDESFLESERTRGRDKYRRLYVGTGKAKPESNKKHVKKYPEKRRAVISSQHIVPPEQGLEKHHWSYNEEHWKDVIWLTKKHHMKGHRFIIYDQDLKKYRRKDTGALLESKQEHETFIKLKIAEEVD